MSEENAVALDELEGAIAPDQEIDFGGEGFKTELIPWLITLGTMGELSDDGEKQSANVTFEGSDENGDYEITVYYTFKHPNPKASSIGRGQFKRLLLAATGNKTGSVSSLTGAYVLGVGGEDNRGFRTVSRFRPVKE
jgi:hypothetical protein